ncbi:hypothetical protein [Paraburkholderia ginsengiterrae]|uniref:hypothetical protein n=1 Tax=Paraburkholderia ginsengiterrae TaxID=1462993 RepID=UPI001041D19F|nr:hypothetical protein [Paraburkholderia ginsengiterrae]
MNTHALRHAANKAGRALQPQWKNGNKDALIVDGRFHLHAPSLAGAARGAVFVRYNSIITHCVAKARASLGDFHSNANWPVAPVAAEAARGSGIEFLGGRPIKKQRSENPRFQPVATDSGQPRERIRHRLQVWQLFIRLVR